MKGSSYSTDKINHTQIYFIITGGTISFDLILLWVDISSTFMGLTVFFAILQVMELLGLNQHIAILSSTLRVRTSSA